MRPPSRSNVSAVNFFSMSFSQVDYCDWRCYFKRPRFTTETSKPLHKIGNLKVSSYFLTFIGSDVYVRLRTIVSVEVNISIY